MLVGEGLVGRMSATVFWILETAAAHADGSFPLEENCLLEISKRGYCVRVIHQGQIAGMVILEVAAVVEGRRGRGRIVQGTIVKTSGN